LLSPCVLQVPEEERIPGVKRDTPGRGHFGGKGAGDGEQGRTLRQCGFGAKIGLPVVPPVGSASDPSRPMRTTHRFGRLREDPPRGLAGQDTGPAEGRRLQGDTRERWREPSTLPSPQAHRPPPRPACTSPAGPSLALTVFSLSARLSPFSGESCSCCWSTMVASGTRTESMVVAVAASKETKKSSSWNPVHWRRPGPVPFKSPADCARRRGRGLAPGASHWTSPVTPPCHAERGRFKLQARRGRVRRAPGPSRLGADWGLAHPLHKHRLPGVSAALARAGTCCPGTV
jgi:hypothetical protein